jgi:hypothetical protein
MIKRGLFIGCLQWRVDLKDLEWKSLEALEGKEYLRLNIVLTPWPPY